jgi:hypothetical protein
MSSTHMLSIHVHFHLIQRDNTVSSQLIAIIYAEDKLTPRFSFLDLKSKDFLLKSEEHDILRFCYTFKNRPLRGYVFFNSHDVQW